MNEITFEETPPVKNTHTISEAVVNLWRDPAQFVRYWNYKGAILSGVLRAPIFLVTYLIGKETLKLAIGAALVQFVFRFFFAGVSGALIQSFRLVEPAWKALLTVLLLVPLVSHLLEFAFQAAFGYFTGTQDHTGDAILRSVCVSIISALFTLFAMRRGIMIVGESESKSLMSDISKLPVIIFHFCAFIPNEISYMLRRGAYLGALLGVVTFGLFAQLLVWAVTNRPFWTYSGGRNLGVLKYWGVDGVVLLVIAVAISTFTFIRHRKHKHTTQA